MKKSNLQFHNCFVGNIYSKPGCHGYSVPVCRSGVETWTFSTLFQPSLNELCLFQSALCLILCAELLTKRKHVTFNTRHDGARGGQTRRCPSATRLILTRHKKITIQIIKRETTKPNNHKIWSFYGYSVRCNRQQWRGWRCKAGTKCVMWSRKLFVCWIGKHMIQSRNLIKLSPASANKTTRLLIRNYSPTRILHLPGNGLTWAIDWRHGQLQGAGHQCY